VTELEVHPQNFMKCTKHSHFHHTSASALSRKMVRRFEACAESISAVHNPCAPAPTDRPLKTSDTREDVTVASVADMGLPQIVPERPIGY
jgi:hypothetical protein